MKKILCPTDFSKTAGKALDYAVYIAQRAHAHLTLLHVVHLPIVDTSDTAMVASELLGEQTRDANEKLKAKCLFLEEQFGANRTGGFTCDYQVKEALLTDMARHLTSNEGYDLVVMGTTGANSTMEELLIGSNTEALIEEVKCPVFSIPATAPAPNLERIVFAADYNEQDCRALAEVVALGSLSGADIHVVHVAKEVNEEGRARAQQFWSEVQQEYPGVPFTFQEMISKHRDEGLKTYYHDVNGSLLAILRKEKNFLEDLFSQGLAERLTYQAAMPLLVLQGKNV